MPNLDGTQNTHAIRIIESHIRKHHDWQATVEDFEVVWGIE
jgi:hypothetical protein